MIKNSLVVLTLVLCCVFNISAQQKEGRWTLFPAVGDNFSEVIETPERTYLLSGTTLFSLSDDDNESYAYNVFNKLTERARISKIAYNEQNKYLFIAYDNGNIDLLYDNGRTVNMPQIKDATLTLSRGVLDVAFGHDRIFVGTEFGLVVFDDQNHRVIESGIYNKPVDHLFVMGDHLLILTDEHVYASRFDDRHLELASQRPCRKMWKTDVAKLNDNVLIYTYVGDTNLYAVTFDFEAKTEKETNLGTLSARNDLKSSSDGVYLVDNGKIVSVGQDMKLSYANLPAEYAKSSVFFDNLSSVWVNTPSGITRLNLEKETPEVLMQPYKPEAITTTRPFKMLFSHDGQKLYVGNIAYSFLYDVGFSDNPAYPTSTTHFLARTCVIDNNGIVDVQPSDLNPPSTVNPTYFNLLKQGNTTKMTGGPMAYAIDPDDPDMYYVTNFIAGIFVIKDGELYHVIDTNNCPYYANGRQGDDRIMHVDIDNEGNLWIVQGLDDKNAAPYVMILPAAKRKNLRDIKKSDWIAVPLHSDFVTSRDIFTTFLKQTPINIFTRGGWEPLLVFQAHNNTPLNMADDRLSYFQGYTDQNGNTISPRHVSCAVEDHDGKVWFGLHTGTFVVDNPGECIGASALRVRRPIVARNDGTGLGDYLLESQVVYDIAVDAANRKWYATNSGAYLVSADGTEILAHYDTDNSPLPSNVVGAVECDPNGNKVYFGTDNGLVCYDSDAAPAAEDYSEVYTYPNPVRPDYTGWITVAGLMDNSLVKIADAAGNVFFQGRSEGGMVSWDGCDSAGRRVKSGVYYVFASRSSDGSSKGAVAKILVIN